MHCYIIETNSWLLTVVNGTETSAIMEEVISTSSKLVTASLYLFWRKQSKYVTQAHTSAMLQAVRIMSNASELYCCLLTILTFCFDLKVPVCIDEIEFKSALCWCECGDDY